MHALPLAAPDLSAALPVTVPAAAGVAPDDRFSTHLWAAAGARPGQPVQNAVPARDAEGAASGNDPEALAPDVDALPVFSEDQDAAEAATPFDPSNLVAGLIATWLPWQAQRRRGIGGGRCRPGRQPHGRAHRYRLGHGPAARGHRRPRGNGRARPASARWSQRQSPPASIMAQPAAAGIAPAAADETRSPAPALSPRSPWLCRPWPPRPIPKARCGSSLPRIQPGRRRIAGTFSGRPESLPHLDVTAGCSARRGRDPRCRLAPSGLINDRCPAGPDRPGRAPPTWPPAGSRNPPPRLVRPPRCSIRWSANSASTRLPPWCRQRRPWTIPPARPLQPRPCPAPASRSARTRPTSPSAHTCPPKPRPTR